ncbi:MAG: DUF4440 domain-containing protein [Azospirillaceae bacterium]|nr:DUF4440 domain-containing protein [Azospirillaceae bacterium]
MSPHPLASVIEAADRAISAEDFDSLLDFYAEDAILVVQPGLNAIGKAAIRRAFVAIADHFHHSLTVKQGDMVVLEGGGDSALVVMETRLEHAGSDGTKVAVTRQATYVFRKNPAGQWLCVIDNSYGTDLLKAPGPL